MAWSRSTVSSIEMPTSTAHQNVESRSPRYAAAEAPATDCRWRRLEFRTGRSDGISIRNVSRNTCHKYQSATNACSGRSLVIEEKGWIRSERFDHPVGASVGKKEDRRRRRLDFHPTALIELTDIGVLFWDIENDTGTPRSSSRVLGVVEKD